VFIVSEYFALVDRSTNVGFLTISGVSALLERPVRCVQVDGVFQDDIQDWGSDNFGVVTTGRVPPFVLQ
jgi:hypothetical protein